MFKIMSEIKNLIKELFNINSDVRITIENADGGPLVFNKPYNLPNKQIEEIWTERDSDTSMLTGISFNA